MRNDKLNEDTFRAVFRLIFSHRDQISFFQNLQIFHLFFSEINRIKVVLHTEQINVLISFLQNYFTVEILKKLFEILKKLFLNSNQFLQIKLLL